MTIKSFSGPLRRWLLHAGAAGGSHPKGPWTAKDASLGEECGFSVAYRARSPAGGDLYLVAAVRKGLRIKPDHVTCSTRAVTRRKTTSLIPNWRRGSCARTQHSHTRARALSHTATVQTHQSIFLRASESTGR